MLKTKVINTQTNDVYEAQLSPRSVHQAECLIGRHPNCDLVLDGPAVSRVHGRLLFETDASRFNNEEIGVKQAYAIAPDDILRIGEFASVNSPSSSNLYSRNLLKPRSRCGMGTPSPLAVYRSTLRPTMSKPSASLLSLLCSSTSSQANSSR